MKKILLLLIATTSCASLMGMERQVIPLSSINNAATTMEAMKQGQRKLFERAPNAVSFQETVCNSDIAFAYSDDQCFPSKTITSPAAKICVLCSYPTLDTILCPLAALCTMYSYACEPKPVCACYMATRGRMLHNLLSIEQCCYMDTKTDGKE